MDYRFNRRAFVSAASLTGSGLALGVPGISFATGIGTLKPAILGGQKAHAAPFPEWPVINHIDDKAMNEVMQSKKWCRLGSDKVDHFEAEYQKLTGAKHCLATSSGTSALYTALGALDIGPGDEVIIPVYTFIATYNVVVLNYALPIFVDTDIESFQIDADKIEAAITKQTKVIMPVHIGGSPVNLDKIMAISHKSNIPVIEDACQAHLAEWRGQKVGNYGLAGAFSFQASKNLNSGEGGAIITNNETFAQTCYNFHNQGRDGRISSFNPGTGTRGTNMRLSEFQGNLLVAQMTRVIEQTNRRTENANYLTKMLKEIPGITPAKLYEGTTRSAYHLYMFRYDKNHFGGLSRSRFLDALSKEGVPCSNGYGMMNKEEYVTGLAKNRHYLNIYGEKTMKQWLERNQCPQNDLLTTDQSVWFFQNMLLGTKTDLDQIVEAIRKIQIHASEINKA